jgi:hypothetical protein
MIWRFLRSRAFHAAGGEVLASASGEREEWLRGERRVVAGSLVEDGEMGTCCRGVGSMRASTAGSAGEER